MIGFIGGSGVYDSLPLSDTREAAVETPFGDPSSPLTVGSMPDGTEIAFLARHGRDHEYSPTTVPYRANLHALKQLGVDRVLASNAVGSLREDLPPRTLVVPDQLFDRTHARSASFFGEGCVAHVSLAEPYCPHLADHLVASARGAVGGESPAGAEVTGDAGGDGDVNAESVADGGTYVCIEGPQFSTRAESEHYRASGFDVVGMTAAPEAALAREAELCYATVAGVTDYDVWRDDAVTLQEVLENAAANETAIKATVRRAVDTMPDARTCDCATALEGAINTPASAIPPDTRDRLDLLVDPYLDD